MTKLADLTRLVAAIVPDVAEPVVQESIVRAAMRFFTETKTWREEIEVDRPRADAYITEMLAPRGAEIVAVLDASINHRPIQLAGDENMESPRPGTYITSVYGQGQELFFNGRLKGDEVIYARAALRPILSATSIPDRVLSEYQDILISGGVMETMRMNPAAWNNPQMMDYYRGEFLNGIERNRNRGRSGRTHAARVVSYGGI